MAIAEQEVQLMLSGKPSNEEGSSEVDVLVKINPPTNGTRTSAHIVCVVDVSGSMGSVAKVQNENGDVEDDGLSYLDVVKHATRTIIRTLGNDDVFSLVSYNATATVVLEGQEMTEEGQKKAEKELDALRPQGSTNIWDGLHSALEIIKRTFEKSPSKAGCIMLLTDGMPNIRPPRGEQAMLQKYKDANPDLRCTVNTFGFGYQLDSPLLCDLSSIGNGSYAFIPDSGFVGTVFVNSISNTLSTMASDVNISLEPTNGATIKTIHGGLPTTMTSWGASIAMGSLNYGQSRDLVITMKVPNHADKYVDVTVTYMPTGATDASRITGEVQGTVDDNEIDVQRFRGRFVDEVTSGLKHCNEGKRFIPANLPESVHIVENFATEITNHPNSGDDRVQGLLTDLTGQVTEAFGKKEWFQKWGRHYIPSLLTGHRFQQCNNFKDPGVQFYGGQLFKDIQNVADDIFLNLPAPVPTAKVVQKYGNNTATRAKAKPVNMARYYNNYGGCFDGFGQVQMADGSTRFTHEVRKGDKVLSLNGQVAEVLCAIHTHMNGGKTHLVTLASGLKLTPYHPIIVDGEWKFPADVATPKHEICAMVYNFVLSNGHAMVINGVEACTLGHGITENKVIQHAYFGTQAIVRDLKGLHGWDNGLINFKDGWLTLDEETNMLGGLKPSHEVGVN